MKYYYYKDGEKFGPVEDIELDHLADWGDITPETTIEKEDGKQVPASDIFLPSMFGTNPAGIPLDTARKRAVFCGYAKLFALLGMILSCIIMVPAGCCENNRLLIWCLVAMFVLLGVEIGIGCYVAAYNLKKVPPFPPTQEDE